MNVSGQTINVSSPHLLLIDDDLSLGKLIREYCETDGLTVTPAATGEEGIYLSQQKHFQLIILDVTECDLFGTDALPSLLMTIKHDNGFWSRERDGAMKPLRYPWGSRRSFRPRSVFACWDCDIRAFRAPRV
jgi:hypothetical protein